MHHLFYTWLNTCLRMDVSWPLSATREAQWDRPDSYRIFFLELFGFVPSGLAVLGITIAMLGCATYQKDVGAARDLVRQGEFAKACEQLKPFAEKQNGDQLVYLFDYGSALQLNGQYSESNRVLEL